MPTIKKTYVVTTESVDFFSLNHDIAAAIKETGTAGGMICVVVPKGGAGLLVFENLPQVRTAVAEHIESMGGEGTVPDRLRRSVALAPRIQTAMLPRSIACPYADGNLLLAPYEEVMLVDCEPKSQRREVIIAVTPETGGEPQ